MCLIDCCCRMTFFSPPVPASQCESVCLGACEDAAQIDAALPLYTSAPTASTKKNICKQRLKPTARWGDQGILSNYITMLLWELLSFLVISHTTPRQDQTISCGKMCLYYFWMFCFLKIKRINWKKRKEEKVKISMAFFFNAYSDFSLPLYSMKNTLEHKRTHSIKPWRSGWIILITLDYSWPDRISSSVERGPERPTRSDRHAHLSGHFIPSFLLLATVT